MTKKTGIPRNWIVNANSTTESVDVYSNCEGETVFAGGVFSTINGHPRSRLVGMSGITKPAFTMLSNNPACNNTYDGQINIEVTGAGTPLNYLLDNNLIQHHGQFNNINAGTHHLRVNGFDGCLFLDSTLVLASEADTTFPAFEVTLAGNELTCTNLSSGS
ncbi:MAG: hypothetical protein IT240_10515, partial [Bacteroidia bacterium]|nr:hypothetical protein [Bacteroidia bacterium]